ncbi:MAG: hypothetical protein OXC57_06485 [Rhodobacteraceae bacterium]|nr:hypothetical protein [Paracoccaceae bacterium]
MKSSCPISELKDVQSLLEIIAVRDVYIWDLEVQLGEDRKKVPGI